MSKKTLALIPARGGSKGLSRKNVKPLLGKPLIAWTIEVAKKSRYIDRVVVSTEDNEIAGIAKKHGAEVPFMRPFHLSTDEATTEDCVIHALNWLRDNEEYRSDFVLLLEVTSPLRAVEDIDSSISILLAGENEIDAVFGLTEATEHPFGMKIMDGKNIIRNFINADKEYTRRQDLPPVYRGNGAVYLCKTEVFLNKKTFTPERTFGYLMPKERSVDINDEIDFKIAEVLMKAK